MLRECIPKPTKEQWEMTALEFERRSNFAHCLRAVDGKYMRVIEPEHSGSMFYNYKDCLPSPLVWMAVADGNCRFVYVGIGSYGEDWFCHFWKVYAVVIIQKNMLVLPSERPLAGTASPNIPYFVGKEGLALITNIFDLLQDLTWVLKDISQLSLVQTTIVCGMCFWNFE